MGKTADDLDTRCRAAWLKSLGGRGGKSVKKSVASFASLTSTLASGKYVIRVIVKNMVIDSFVLKVSE